MMRFIIFGVITLATIISTPSYPAERSHRNETIDQSLKSQFFCVYCHVMTYPKVMKKAYESWKVDKHNNIRCVECHYPPESLEVKIPAHERIPRDEGAALMKTDWEYMNTELAVLSRLITILNMDESVVRTRPRLDDRNCTTSRCHPTTGKGKASDEKLKEAAAMLNEAQQNVQLVEAGGGVHNQKYSIQLLDNAMDNFEEVMSLLE